MINFLIFNNLSNKHELEQENYHDIKIKILYHKNNFASPLILIICF